MAAGITFEMAAHSTLVVQKNAGLILAGTQDAPIVVTSAVTPSARGDWGDIEFYTNSLGSVNAMNWVGVEYGGSSDARSTVTGGFFAEVWLESDSGAQINNCTVTNSAHNGLTVEPNATLVSFQNNTLFHNAEYPIQIDVDDVRQLQPYNNTWIPNDLTGIGVSGSPLRTNTHWGPLGTNYFVQNSFVVDYGLTSGMTTWTIDPGTSVTLGAQLHIDVTDQGTVIANGVNEAGMINFAGQGAEPVDGTDWGYFHVFGPANNLLNWVRFRYGGAGGMGSLYIEGTHTVVSIDNIFVPVMDADAAPVAILICGGSVTVGGGVDPNLIANISFCP